MCFCFCYGFSLVNSCALALVMISVWYIHRHPSFRYSISSMKTRILPLFWCCFDVYTCFCFFDGISLINTNDSAVVIPVWSGYIWFSFCQDLILITMVLALVMTSFWSICIYAMFLSWFIHLQSTCIWLYSFVPISWRICVLSRYICIDDALNTCYHIILVSVHTYMVCVSSVFIFIHICAWLIFI